MEKGMLSITFRKKTPEEIVELVKKSGLTTIEWGGDIHVLPGDVKTAEYVGKLTRDAGLTVASYGSYYKCTAEDHPFDDVLASAAALGAKIIRVWAGNKNFDDASEAERDQVYSYLTYAVEQSAKLGITVATELHINSLTNTLNGILEMLKRVPGLKTYWQQGSYGLTADEECEVIKALGSSVVNAHISCWMDNTLYPLSKIADRLEKYIPTLEKHTCAHAIMIEFVAGSTPEQFFDDANTLLSAGK